MHLSITLLKMYGTLNIWLMFFQKIKISIRPLLELLLLIRININFFLIEAQFCSHGLCHSILPTQYTNDKRPFALTQIKIIDAKQTSTTC